MALPQQDQPQIQLDCKGLFTNPNDLSKVPQGALLDATNMVIDRDGIGEQRRGFKAYGTALNLGTSVVDSLFLYQNKMIAHYGTKFAFDTAGDGSVWTEYTGNYSVPTGAYAVHSIQSNKNIFFSTSTGIQKLDVVSGTIKSAGVPQGLDGSGTATGVGWFTNTTQVCYRVLWGYTDANNNTILGAPSGRIIVANNTGSATNTSLTFTIPANITTSYFYQLYRSPMSVDLSTTPTDECQLVIQANPTSGEITAKSITVTDSVPDALRGATIYTAASQQGIGQSNYTPPIAVDMTFFKNYTFYGNCVGQQSINLSLLSVGGTNGLAINDTITIAGTVYTAKAAEVAASAQFLCSSAGTPSVNIDTTARSLVHVINTYASNTSVYAYYVSGFSDLPGQIIIQERGIGGGTFALAVSRATAWYFQSGTSSSSTLPARVYISKLQQPEAVPLLNFLDIGSSDKSILRIIALRNSIFVFKQDGVFRITGDDLTSFAVTPWDNTVVLRSPEAAVLLNNQIYCFTTQGVIAVSETGSAIVSRPIETDLLKISASQFTTFDAVTFGVGYESDRKYILNTVTATGDIASTQSYVYNYITNTWTRWLMPHNVSAGILNTFDNKMYFASADSTSKFLFQERKSFTTTDYADDEYTVTVTGYSGKTLSVTDTTNVRVGYSIVQGFNNTEVTAVVNGTTLTMRTALVWANGAATAYKPINASVQWVPIHGGNPTDMKLFKEIEFFFSNPDFDLITVSISSNISQYDESYTITPISLAGWGSAPWGVEPWGGGRGSIQPIRTWPPIEKCRAHWLLIKLSKSQALTTFGLNGVMVSTMPMSYRYK